METHLTEDLYRRLLDGTLPAGEASALARHLDAPCQACEELLASRTEADAVDGVVDRALTAAVPAAAGARGGDLEFARIQRALARPAAPRRPLGHWVGPTYRFALAAAAFVAVLGGLWAMEVIDRTRHPGWTGEKGVASVAAAVKLRFLVDDGERLDRGLPGQDVPADARLRFELTLGRDAEVALVRVGAVGGPEVFYRQALRAGSTIVTVEGKPAAYPLSGLEGPQRFVAVAAPGALDDARAAEAAAAAAPPGGAPPVASRLEGLALDVVEVNVR